MANPSRAIPIDALGRVLTTEAGEKEIRAKEFTVGSQTAVKLAIAGGPNRRKLFVTNSELDRVVYIGDMTVSTSTGFPLYLYDEIELDVDETAEVWAIADGENTDVRILEVE